MLTFKHATYEWEKEQIKQISLTRKYMQAKSVTKKMTIYMHKKNILLTRPSYLQRNLRPKINNKKANYARIATKMLGCTRSLSWFNSVPLFY